MFYAFIDGHFIGSANHVKYLKSRVDEELELFGGFWAVIYRGKRSACCRQCDGEWMPFVSLKENRPEIGSIL